MVQNSQKCLLFAYGLLLPSQKPPRSLSSHWPDAVQGLLYDLGDFPAAVQIASEPGAANKNWILGETLEIDRDELETLDEFEGVDDAEFVRRLVTTKEGYIAYIYEYNRPIPGGLKPITRWRD
jgi:gamma-glutamylcyclotransferase (GGCT)/AIG2-like uncharacterized protein YtfP